MWKYEGFDAGDKTKDGGEVGKCSKACQRGPGKVTQFCYYCFNVLSKKE